MPYLPKKDPFITSSGAQIYYQGPDLAQGCFPALIYFALSAVSSLYEDPYNQPVIALSSNPIRIFSWNLPFHEPNHNPHEAMKKWTLTFRDHPSYFSEFIDRCIQNINDLIEQGFIDADHLAVAGLSRGGFIATYLAAHDYRIRTVLGFAPLTRFSPSLIEEFGLFPLSLYESIALSNLAPHLFHKSFRFYIGNHDTRVGTDSCFEFIKTLADTSFSHGIRSPEVELIIYPSIGHKGHGTPPYIFQEGANWIRTKLIKD